MTGAVRMHDWPELPYAALRPTLQTLHLWTQIVGKMRVRLSPWLNHSWNATLYVSPRGLTTSPVPYGEKCFDIEFDLIAHHLRFRVSDGGEACRPLNSGSMAEFYAQVRATMAGLGMPVDINTTPNEIPDSIPFPDDAAERAYDPGAAHNFWRALVQCDRVFNRFRTEFIGKASPVHLFWGSFDLAVTRFSGRTAPLHPGGIPRLPDAITREAYSHEVSSAGFWPGGNGVEYAAFYSYAYPAPAGFASAAVEPAGARFNAALGEFLLPYDAVRTAADPDALLLSFLRSTYAAAANLGKWDRTALETAPGRLGRPRLVI